NLIFATFTVDRSLVVYLFFFFSSRRRHTRFSRDWSSDVCSSDLSVEPDVLPGEYRYRLLLLTPTTRKARDFEGRLELVVNLTEEIGRASCRERVEISVVAGGVKERERRETVKRQNDRAHEQRGRT